MANDKTNPNNNGTKTSDTVGTGGSTPTDNKVNNGKNKDKEKLSGSIVINSYELSLLLKEINNNKTKLSLLKIDALPNGEYLFEIENIDAKDNKKLYQIINKYLSKSEKGSVKREKNGAITDSKEGKRGK